VALRPRLSPGVPLIHVEAEYLHLTSRYNPRQEMKEQCWLAKFCRGEAATMGGGPGRPSQRWYLPSDWC
jgi:hypothetical protein